MIFLTPRLLLRPFDPSTDAPTLLLWKNSPTFRQYLDLGPEKPVDRDANLAFVKKLATVTPEGFPAFAVCERPATAAEEPDNALKGVEDLFVDKEGRSRYPIIGILITRGKDWSFTTRCAVVSVVLQPSHCSTPCPLSRPSPSTSISLFFPTSHLLLLLCADNGLGTELMTWACDYLFNTLNVHRIELGADSRNLRAIRCYEKVGFVKEGVRRKSFFKGGVWIDAVDMGILEEEFRGKWPVTGQVN